MTAKERAKAKKKTLKEIKSTRTKATRSRSKAKAKTIKGIREEREKASPAAKAIKKAKIKKGLKAVGDTAKSSSTPYKGYTLPKVRR